MTLLYCHRVLPQSVSARFGPDLEQALDEEAFERVLDDLKGRLSDWDQCLAEQDEGPGGRVGLTFDDGYADFLTTALPLVEAAGVRVLLFVTTRFVDQREAPYEYVVGDLLHRCPDLNVSIAALQPCLAYSDEWKRYKSFLSVMKSKSPAMRRRMIEVLLEDNVLDESELEAPRMLTWRELRELSGHPLVDIGAHTLSHPYLPASRVADAVREIFGGKRELEDQLAMPVRYFAYPYGASTWWLRGIVRAAGFDYGFATDGAGRGRTAVPRINVIDWIKSG